MLGESALEWKLWLMVAKQRRVDFIELEIDTCFEGSKKKKGRTAASRH